MNECKRYKVFAIGLSETGCITTTNGNQAECTGEIGNCGCTHAEIRLLEQMPKPDVVIVSVSPCFECAKALVLAGVKNVFYYKPYRLPDGIAYLVNNDVRCQRLWGGCNEMA